jgi:two-component system sensor histidine kinase KdpD
MFEKQRDSIIKNIFIGPVFIVMALAIGMIFEYTNIPETNIAIIHLLAVVAISIFTQEYIVSVIYSVRTTLVFNYFFTAPYMAFEIDSVSYIISFVVMVTVSLIVTMLTQRIKKNAQIATQRAEENRRGHEKGNEACRFP